MKAESIVPLVDPEEIHAYVLGLWADGPIRRSHAAQGPIYDLIERFARRPRFFYEPSDSRIEWTHFSPWWGGILLCDYDNPNIRDLRYLHEIYHAATMPYLARANLPTLRVKNFRNEREASTFTEMAIYLELPELRPLTFEHPIFVDRFLFPDGDLKRPDERLLRRWKEEPDLVFQELMFERARVVLAEDDEVDVNDPQIIWLRRFQEQEPNWLEIWSDRYQLVETAMLRLRDECEKLGRRTALERHLAWLQSPDITDRTDVPFRREAVAFRQRFDELVEAYTGAMARNDQTAVKGKGL